MKWRSRCSMSPSSSTIALWVSATRPISGMLLGAARTVRSPAAIRPRVFRQRFQRVR